MPTAGTAGDGASDGDESTTAGRPRIRPQPGTSTDGRVTVRRAPRRGRQAHHRRSEVVVGRRRRRSTTSPSPGLATVGEMCGQALGRARVDRPGPARCGHQPAAGRTGRVRGHGGHGRRGGPPARRPGGRGARRDHHPHRAAHRRRARLAVVHQGLGTEDAQRRGPQPRPPVADARRLPAQRRRAARRPRRGRAPGTPTSPTASRPPASRPWPACRSSATTACRSAPSRSPGRRRSASTPASPRRCRRPPTCAPPASNGPGPPTASRPARPRWPRWRPTCRRPAASTRWARPSSPTPPGARRPTSPSSGVVEGDRLRLLAPEARRSARSAPYLDTEPSTATSRPCAALHERRLVTFPTLDDIAAADPRVAARPRGSGPPVRGAAAPLIGADGDAVGRAPGAVGHAPAVRRRAQRPVARVADLCAQSTERSRLFDAEHRVRRDLQRSVLPDRRPGVARPRGGHPLPPGRRRRSGMGGDWYDAIALDARRMCLVVGDVSGHGAGAVATMTQIRTVVHTLVVGGMTLPDVLVRTSAMMQRDGLGYATVLLAVVDPAAGARRLRHRRAPAGPRAPAGRRRPRAHRRAALGARHRPGGEAGGLRAVPGRGRRSSCTPTA